MSVQPTIRQRFHIVIVTPANYPHSAAFNELAETLQYGLQALGYGTGMAVNQLEAGAVNIIFGAHLLSAGAIQGLPANTIIYNTEQIDVNSVWMEGQLFNLIQRFETWDYSRRNIEQLQQRQIGHNVKLLPVGFMPQIARIPVVEQDIDVLFYGSVNPRRAKVLDALRASGLNVMASFNCYGQERDALIARAKVVLNVHFYEAKIFEIVRVSYLLANRKAVVSEMAGDTDIEPIYREAIAGAPYDQLVEVCKELVTDRHKRQALEQRAYDIMSARRQDELLRTVLAQDNNKQESKTVVLPTRINLGSGKSYAPQCLNIDINSYWQPDIVADLSADNALDNSFESARFGQIKLERGYFQRIDAIEVLEHVPALTTLMGHCLELLAVGGEFHISVPYELSYGAWQDPTHVRAFNERSWLYYTDWFWYLGWREARFDLVTTTMKLSPLGVKLKEQGQTMQQILLQPRAVDTMLVVLRKRLLTVEEQKQVEDYLRRPERQ